MLEENENVLHQTGFVIRLTDLLVVRAYVFVKFLEIIRYLFSNFKISEQFFFLIIQAAF